MRILIHSVIFLLICGAHASQATDDVEAQTKAEARFQKHFEEFLADAELRRLVIEMSAECGMPPDNPLIARWIEAQSKHCLASEQGGVNRHRNVSSISLSIS